MAKNEKIASQVIDDVAEGEIVEAKIYNTQSKVAKWWNRTGLAWAFMLPFLVFFTLFTVIPILTSIRYCFTTYDMISEATWSGLENYRYMLLEDDLFALCFKNTFVLALIMGPPSYIIAFFFAWMINNMKHTSFWVTVFYTPTLVSGTASAIIWNVLFDGTRLGYLNYALMKMGLILEPIPWTTTKEYIIPIAFFLNLWGSLGGNFLVFFAGMQNVRKELYEAGAIDGISSPYQELWYLTLPLMKPQLLYTAIGAVQGALSYTCGIGGYPSPDYCVHTLVNHISDYQGTRYELGYACALSLVMFGITFFFGRLVMKLLSSKDEL